MKVKCDKCGKEIKKESGLCASRSFGVFYFCSAECAFGLMLCHRCGNSANCKILEGYKIEAKLVKKPDKEV